MHAQCVCSKCSNMIEWDKFGSRFYWCMKLKDLCAHTHHSTYELVTHQHYYYSSSSEKLLTSVNFDIAYPHMHITQVHGRVPAHWSVKCDVKSFMHFWVVCACAPSIIASGEWDVPKICGCIECFDSHSVFMNSFPLTSTNDACMCGVTTERNFHKAFSPELFPFAPLVLTPLHP